MNGDTFLKRLLTMVVLLLILVTPPAMMYRWGRSSRARADQRTIDSLTIVLLDARLTSNEVFLSRVAECIAVTTPALDHPESTDGTPNRRGR